MTLWRLFETAAARFPDRPAIQVQRGTSVDAWSYARLLDEALARAAWLIDHGAAAGDRCAILADNDAAWCATYLAILRIGAVVVPLDTNYSAAQVATIVRDASPRVVFVSGRLADRVVEASGIGAGLIVASVHDRPAVRAALPPPPESDESVAIILYTSGTTADPKGVVLTHANLIAERNAAFAAVAVSEQDSVLGVLPLFHSLAQLANLLLPLTIGARVVFLETVSSGELMRALVEREITIFACVPQFFYLIRQQVRQRAGDRGWLASTLVRVLLPVSFTLRRMGLNVGRLVFGQVHAATGRSLRLFVTGGSKFDSSVGRDLHALGFSIVQAYGLTETSGAATITRPDEAHLDSVGRPLPGQQVKVLASDDQSGEGEIAIRGPIVMQGYYNRPDATAAVLQDGWLLTGDLGRFDSAGRLTITGRKKDVIVLPSGKNVYPEEVESQYQQSIFIKEICVLGRADPSEPTVERLYAVVVPDMELMRTKRIVNVGDLLRFEIEGQSVHLPAHKRVLGYEICFDPLPRTTTGKLRRHEIARRVTATKHEPAATAASPHDGWPDEAHAAAVFEAIRRRVRDRRIFPEANLELDLGLDSMERVELIADIERRTNVRVADEHAARILNVAQLVEATRPSGSSAAGEPESDSWERILRDLPGDSHPILSGLLARRPLAAPLFYMAARLLRLLLPPVRASGRQHLPRQGPYLICPNHQGYLDPFIVGGVLPFRVFRDLFFVGAAEYFETPVMAWIARQCNCVPVDPDANLVPAMQAGAFGLKHGKVLMLFPEGERSIDGTVKRFKKGAPILSAQLHVPIVPVALRGAYEVWPRNRRIDWRYLFPWNRHRIRIEFLPPVFAGADSREAAVALRDSVASAWEKL